LGCFSLLKKSKTCGSYPDNLVPVEIFLCDETAILGILPNGKSRTGGVPNLDHFLIGSVAGRQPLKQVYNQCVNSCVSHGLKYPKYSSTESSNHPELGWCAISDEVAYRHRFHPSDQDRVFNDFARSSASA